MRTQLYFKSVLIFITILMPVLIYAQDKNDFSRQISVYFSSGVTREVNKNKPSDTLINLTTSVQRVLNNYQLDQGSIRPAFPGFKEADTLLVIRGSKFEQDPLVVKDMNKSKIYVISCPDIQTRDQLLAELRKNPEVLFAEPNGISISDVVPNDPSFVNNQQWSLRNNSAIGAHIHAEQAWDIFKGAVGNIIAIIDPEGVNGSHPDLSGKVVGDVGTIGTHGTECAGVAAANTNNGIGIAGVDWNAGIYSSNISGTDDNAKNSKIINAVNYSPNVRVLSNSWGLVFPDETRGRYSTIVRQAFSVAFKANRIICASMGNYNLGPTNPATPNYPAAFNTGIIAVGATNNLDRPASFSTRGAHIDVAAPGEDILSTSGTNGYASVSGTSFSTPMVAGIASLIIGYRPQLYNEDVEQVLRLSANDDQETPGFDNATGAGRVNAHNALLWLQNNNVYQWSATGGEVTSTSGNMQRIFLGVSGLSDATYIVRRLTVEKTVVFPNRMCNMIGAWARGIGTSGLREEGGYCFGEGFCEVVPGSVSNSGMRLRTYVYEVLSILGQPLGYYPTPPQSVNFAYSVWGIPAATQITGSENLCTTAAYTINGLPSGATVSWSASPAGLATSSISGNTITLTKSGTTNEVLTLTGTYTCNGIPNSIQKTIYVGPVKPTVTSQWVSSSETYLFTATPIPGATYKWYDSGVLDYEGPSNTYNVGLGCGLEAYISCTVTTVCGTSPSTNEIKVRGRCNRSFVISPNPTSSILTVSLDKSSATRVAEKKISVNGIIKQITIADVNGVIKKRFANKDGVLQSTMSISDLKAGFYLVNVFDGYQWESHKLIIQH
jgi:hypothetical protein